MFHPNVFENLHQHHPVDMSHKTSETNLDMLIRDDDHDSNMDAPSSDDQDPNLHRKKKKRFHRHTQHQIQELEASFKECPHPDDKQRKELSMRLSLKPLQVKFWFQNKRTQLKLRFVLFAYALANATCPDCGGPAAMGEMSSDEQHLRIENTRLREEIDRISTIAAKYVGKQPLTYPDVSSHDSSRSLDLQASNFNSQGTVGDMLGARDLLLFVAVQTQNEKPVIIELAIAAMEELIRMAQIGEPLWVPTLDDSSHENLSEVEYMRSFPRGIGPKPMGLKSEASRNQRLS
ncbi:hypothetical protein L1987_68131 [Smallanthus sonchifolius]|uniref:Uncharacterized protein n=1 Tax=Smallanthus sonchifolius TaxID=185202 RepID=A0ACB9B497_9ASTR|nr:hypothetical protein L1987_68131 [Smallanthus sonchifolius]